MSSRITIEKIEELAKRRGFFWQSSEIYGGFGGFYDYGHLGFLLKSKFENAWRKFFLSLNDMFYEISPAVIMPEQVFQASGHLKSFQDPLCKCKKCGNIERADHIIENALKESFEGKTPKELTELIRKHNIRCPKCGGEFGEVGELNMMFPLNIGADSETKAYLRPETAQGAYVNFKRMFEILRKKLPLGLAIIGKAYRNEISPRQLLIRTREFSQAELQIFFDPEKINEHPRWEDVANYQLRLTTVKDRKKIIEMTCEDVNKKIGLPKFYVYYMAKIQQFYFNVMKIPKELFRFKELSEEEKAFYNKYHWDIELNLASLGGFKEIAGIHYRTDHDLSGHQNLSKEKMSVSIDGKKIIPHVIELSFGVDRNIYALLELAYSEERDQIILKFPRNLSPVDVAILPLVKKDGMPEKAREVENILKQNFVVFYDESGSIGRRYAREDERGTAFAVTIDSQTMQDDTVTLRDRDTTVQIRVPVKELTKTINKLMHYEIDFRKAGKVVYEP